MWSRRRAGRAAPGFSAPSGTRRKKWSWWIDAHCEGKPDGVDVVLPATYDKRAERPGHGPVLADSRRTHEVFEDLLEREDGPHLPPGEEEALKRKAAVIAAGVITNGSQLVAMLGGGAQGVWCGTLWLFFKMHFFSAAVVMYGTVAR